LFVFVYVGSNLRQSKRSVPEVVMGSFEEKYKWFD